MATTETKSYLDEPPAYDIKDLSSAEQKDLMTESSSVRSVSTDATRVAPTNFHGSKTLLLNARGIPVLRFPIPSREMQVPITTPSGDLAYMSTRAKWTSGNAVLSNAEGKELIASEYQFGPNRDPKLRLLNKGGEEIHTKSNWTSRRQEYAFQTGQGFIWQYVKEVDPSPANTKGKKRSFLVLEVPVTTPSSPITTGKGKKKQETRRVARLVRNEESRTPGTKACFAGNGGGLEIDEQALEATGLGEDLVIASCLMMLKKEIDRRRLVQAWVLTAAISGGS